MYNLYSKNLSNHEKYTIKEFSEASKYGKIGSYLKNKEIKMRNTEKAEIETQLYESVKFLSKKKKGKMIRVKIIRGFIGYKKSSADNVKLFSIYN